MFYYSEMLRTTITTNFSFTRPLTVLLLATFHEKQTKHDFRNVH